MIWSKKFQSKYSIHSHVQNLIMQLLNNFLLNRINFSSCWVIVLFVIAVAPALAFLALAVPSGEVPDEVAHILRADSVRHGEIAGFRRPRVDEQGKLAVDVMVRADIALLTAGFAFSPGTPLIGKQVTQARLNSLLNLTWTNRLELVSIPNTAVYPPLLYAPAALAMQIAKWRGRGPYVAILAARLMNAIIYVLVGIAAIGLARRGRVVLFAILCLPMSLSLAASVNQDGLVIACAGLTGSLLTRSGRGAWWCGAVLFGFLAMAKPHLLPLALLVLAVVPSGLHRQVGSVVAGLMVATGPALVWAGAMGLFVAAPFVRGPAQPAGPLWAGPPDTMFSTTNPGEQLRILLASPIRLLSLPVQSAYAQGWWLWNEVIGVLGTLDVILPQQLYTAWGWGLAGAMLAGFMVRQKQSGDVRLIVLAAALVGAVASIWCTFLLQYLSWTRVGESLVEGVQGRYFIPIAALALPVATLPILRVPADALLRIICSVLMILLALIGPAIMPLIMLCAYYMR